MLDEGYDLNQEPPEEEAPPPEESSNRTFLIVGGVFAGLIFLTLVCGAIYVLWLGPRLATQRNAAQATIEAGNAQVVQQMTSTAEAALWTPTPEFTNTPLPTDTPAEAASLASPTPIIAAVANTATATTDPAILQATQTQFALQVAGTLSALTPTGTLMAGAAAATAIPKTGFFDEIGLPSLIVLTLALVAVIILSRRLRNAPTK
jgi:hypothetical protein